MFLSKQSEVVVAVEIGSSKIVTAVGELRSDGAMSLLDVGETRSAGIRKGQIVEYDSAQQAIHSAVSDAEEKTGATIRDVYITVTGDHIGSKTIRVATSIEDEDRLITAEHTGELEDQAVGQPIPEDHALIHALLQHYQLDNGTRTTEPIGLSSRTLEASYHLTHGLIDSLGTTVRCVKELGLEVKGYALSSFAAGEAVLTAEQKALGAVVIDLGGGITDYIVYHRGSVAHTGCIAVGGDHVTQDLSLGLKLNLKRAELCKIKYGALDPSALDPAATITLERETTAEERVIYLRSIATIMEARVRETLELVAQEIENAGLWDGVNGKVFITGGACKVRGLLPLAQTVFPVPVQLAHNFPFTGVQTYSQRHDLATVLGLLRYAQSEEQRNLRLRGWARVTHSVRELLASMSLF